jgi:hypothetical protein
MDRAVLSNALVRSCCLFPGPCHKRDGGNGRAARGLKRYGPLKDALPSGDGNPHGPRTLVFSERLGVPPAQYRAGFRQSKAASEAPGAS